MPAESNRLSKGKFDGFGILVGFLSFFTFIVIVYYFYIFRERPNPGFVLDNHTGIVLYINEECHKEEVACLEVGDRVIKIGSNSFESYLDDFTVAIYEPFKSGDVVPVEFERNGGIHTLGIRALTRSSKVLSSFSVFFYPALFWAMGTIAVIFLRPRDDRWLVLILFLYDTALWISSGFVGAYQEGYAAVLFFLTLALFLPLSVHVHMILPDARFRAYHRWILPPIYLIGLISMVLLQLHILPRSAAYVSALTAMAVSLGILLLRLVMPAPVAAKVANRVMFYGVSVGLGPVAVMTVAYYLDPGGLLAASYSTLNIGLLLITMPIWPFTYIYSIYRHDLGSFEFRANRLLGAYGFFSIFITIYIVGFNSFAGWWQKEGFDAAFGSLVFSLTFAACGLPGYVKFQRMVDRNIFGMKYSPAEIVGVFAEKIPTAFDMEILEGVIENEILPTLLIRQSALYVFSDGQSEVVYEQEVPVVDRSPSDQDLQLLIGKANRFLGSSPGSKASYDWVRLVLPLSTPDKVIGVWLLGRRDPDDYYAKSDIVLLTNLANQIGPVIENFRLVKKARQEVAENRRLQKQLIHSQKMEAIGRLSAGIAHDFNNILSVIIGYSNLVLAQYRDDVELRRSVENIKDAGERAAGLTKQLLAFSRQQVMEAQVTSMNVIVQDVEKMLRRLTGEDVELTTRLGEGLPNVKIDPGQMGQVIINLAVNARDAMPDGGRLTISAESVTCSSRHGACHNGVPEGLYVLLLVEDTGTGVDPDVQAHMFEPYFTTKDLGTGLGLSMVYGIISQSQGYIFVDSEPDQGTVFSIYLPAATEAEIAQEMAARPRRTLHSGSETILLVEDEQSVRAVTSEILQSNGYKVLEARDGQRALAKFEEHTGEIDLLLTDVVMPHMKGPDLARLLVEKQPSLRVIFMSGYNEETVLGNRAGNTDSILIHKPFSPQSLALKIREVLDGRGQPPGSAASAGA